MKFADRYKKKDDHQLMALVSRGNAKAFEELVVRYQRAVLNFAFRILGDAEEAKDTAQETFLRVFKHGAQYRPTAPFKVFLFRIAKNLCLDNLRKKKPTYMDELPEVPILSGPSDDLQNSAQRAAIVKAIHTLPDRQRIAFLLHHFEGLSYSQVGEVMDTPISAVESLLVRAKRTLRKELQEYF